MPTCACWRPAPTTWVVRTSDFACRAGRACISSGPIAVIARNAQTVLGGVETIARYLYVHSPALKLTLAPRTAQTGLTFTLEVTEPGLPEIVQGYELSMAIAVRIIRLLGGPEARPTAISFMHEQQGSDAAYREALGCPVRFRQTWCGFELPRRLADRRIESADPETRRIATKYLESNYLPPSTSLSERVAELTRRLLPTGQCSVDAIADQLAMHPRSLQRQPGHGGRAMSGPDRAGTPRPGGEIPRRTRIASQPDRGPARLRRTEHPQSLVPTLVREDTSPVPSRPTGAGLAGPGLTLKMQFLRLFRHRYR